MMTKDTLPNKNVNSEIQGNQENNFNELMQLLIQAYQQSVLALTQQSKELISASKQNAQLAKMKSVSLPEEDQKKVSAIYAIIHSYCNLASWIIHTTKLDFVKALQSINDAKNAATESYTIIKQLLESNGMIQESTILNETYHVYPILQVLCNAGAQSLEASHALHSGNIDEYISKIKESVAIFESVNEYTSIKTELAFSLKLMCLRIAESLDSASKNYRLNYYKEPKDRYLTLTGDKVLIIHGHDEAKWRELRDILEKWNLETVVLWEELNAGKSIYEKFTDHANNCSYAIALLTPDDIITNKDNSYNQARPNVLFELGWFYGRYGSDKVSIIVKGDTILPSDLSGIVTFKIKDKVEEIAYKLREQLLHNDVLQNK